MDRDKDKERVNVKYLVNLSKLLKNVYIPLETGRTELKQSMQKLTGQIKQSIQKVSGTITISIPEIPNKRTEELIKDYKVIQNLENTIDEWTSTIKKTLKDEETKKEATTALGEIDYWRNRSANLSTLHQQLTLKPSAVERILELMKAVEEKNADSISLEAFDNELGNLSKKTAEARDNVKFLSTLERQFKAINTGTLTQIEETLSSLMNGLKLVSIISRHITSDKMKHILQCIANEIANKVASEIKVTEIFKKKDPNEAMDLLQRAISCMEKWEQAFHNTTSEMHNEGIDKNWIDTEKDLFGRTNHMTEICKDLKEVIKVRAEFKALLGPEFRAVIAESDGKIQLISDSVESLKDEIENTTGDIFDEGSKQRWKIIFEKFRKKVEEIETQAIDLINSTFERDLKSSEGAFDLLQKFKDMMTRGKIEEEMKKQYQSILRRYESELNEMKTLFQENKSKPPISKNKPPIAGAIAWERSIFARIKRPMVKFYKMEELLTTDKGMNLREKYLDFIQQELEIYEKDLHNKWKEDNENKCLQLLQENILKKKKVGENTVYEVNFSFELRMIIREIKYFDRIGIEPNKTIQNVALQEKDYIKYIDKLNRMLRDYDEAVGTLKKVERELLSQHIKTLKKHLKQGTKSLNWNSLGIDEFIKKCMEAISIFRNCRVTVMNDIEAIEQKVNKIEAAILIKEFDWERKQPMDLRSFQDFFELHKQEIVADLVKDYESIGDQLLKNIEQNAFGTLPKDKDGRNSPMNGYYKYWERRIYNALTKMTIRALATLKALFNPPKNRDPLFKIEATYNYPEINYNPSLNELDKAISKLRKMPLESGKQFVRWMDGFCMLCKEEITSPETNEREKAFTFYKDLNNHPVIVRLMKDINDMDIHLENRIEDNKKQWNQVFKDQRVFDQTTRNKLEKSLEKNPSTYFIEAQFMAYEKSMAIISERTKEKNCFFFNINNAEISKEAIKYIGESIKLIREKLFELGKKDLISIEEDIERYRKELGQDVKGINDLKEILKLIEAIKSESMIMEFRIADVEEKFRMLHAHGKILDEDMTLQIQSLPQKWDGLLREAKLKDFSLIESKKEFAEVTKQEVESFKQRIEEEYQNFNESGPASDVKLDVGLNELKSSKEMVEDFKKRRTELVLAEKLFNLPISSYPQLIEMEDKNKKLDEIYSLYDRYVNGVKEYSSIVWQKLDYAQLKKSADEWNHAVKTMKDDVKKELELPYDKLKAEIEGFLQSVPLIEKLKQGAIKGNHWNKIMTEAGKNFTIDPKTITLGQVFELELHNYKSIVDEVVTQANSEARNEECLRDIEKIWKFESFDLKNYKRGNEEIWVLKGCDNIKEKLEDNIMTLQNISNNKYVGNIQDKVRKWEKNLNVISDVIDIWLVVQRKWMYLESIFGGGIDFRTYLEVAAKKFDNTHKRFKKIMEATGKNRNVYANCFPDTKLNEFKNIHSDLEKCQKELGSYLESKRLEFPRFYFISDDELLLILGNSDPETIQRYMLKLFDNCKSLKFSRGKQVIGMKSDEDEEFDFKQPQKPDGPVEDWMKKVDEEMKRTIRGITKESVFYYAKEKRIDWIQKQLGMVSIVGAQIWWTFAVEDVFRRVKEGDKHAMKKESAKQSKDLDDLVGLIKTDLDPNERNKINTLIKLDVHGRDIIDGFVRDSILDATEFEWESQLRFYWDKKADDILIQQCTGVFTYGYEYQGLNGRLVITPLTDRCVMTLTTALTFHLGGAPAGPAGTGKTETVKDLAKSLAIRCVVNNCGEGLDFQAMGTIYSGLAQTGFWGCFDEFNRINPEVLSVVAAQIKTIQNSLNSGKKTVDLLGNDMPLIPTVGIFVTMNPGYTGRSELPDNLKALFRPVTMVVPNNSQICEIMLMSEGFNAAKLLAKKMTVLYKLASEQLSKQHHYDFGLRALKSVLVMAGSLKREFEKELNEDIVLMRALRDMNMPKFVFDDVPLFTDLIKDLFPNLTPERVGHDDLKEKITQHMDSKLLRFHDDKLFDEQVNKVVQLFETMETRHTTMVIGPTGGGKSVIIDTLKEALFQLDGIPVKTDVINSKSITVNELYGVLDPNTRDWTDGLLSKIFKEANEELGEKKERRWIIFDSDVDSLWVESMNSVMDDNKLLTLANGDRIRLQRHCALLFEVGDLQYASPATISRCGMVYVDPKNLGYEPFYECWAKKKNKKPGIGSGEALSESLMELFRKYVPPCISLILDGVVGDEVEVPLQQISPRTGLNMVEQLTVLLDAILPKDSNLIEPDQIEPFYNLAMIWSLGGCLLDSERDRFDEFVKKTSGKVLIPSSLFLNKYDSNSRNWIEWTKLIDRDFEFPSDRKFASILVPTVDTVRYSWLLEIVMKKKIPCMFIGDSGTAKSVTMHSHLKRLPPEKNSILNINFSSRTTSMDVQLTIEENIDKRSVRQYGPPSGKNLVIFVDDLNMPKIDQYGTQQPIAFLKYLIDKKSMYQRGGDLERRKIIDTQYIGAMTPPSGGNNPVDPRFMSLFTCFNITFPSDQTIQMIYNTILNKYMESYPSDMSALASKLTTITLELHKEICIQLPRTPIKFHYIFNLRDLSRVYEGLCQLTPDKFPGKNEIVRLWRNECTRVYVDRLITKEDKTKVEEDLIMQKIKANFDESQEKILQNPLLFGDFGSTNPVDIESEDPRLYEDLGDFEIVKNKLEKMLEEYNFKKSPMNLVLFDDAVDHLTRIHRIIRLPRGNALLVGVGGSGKQSLSKLAGFTAGYELFQVNLKKNYKEVDLREDLKEMYKQLTTKQLVFLFTDAHVMEESFLELMNNMLTIGMVPALFTEDEKEQLANPFKEEAEKHGIWNKKEGLWNYFIGKVRDNLHIVLAMSPAGDTLRIRCRNFPGLVSSTNIDWFFPWPEGALRDVATHFLVEETLGDKKNEITEHIVKVHLSVQEYSTSYEAQFKRKNYSTPKNYLDFINNYKNLLKTNRVRIQQLVKRLEGGLKTLKKGAEDTEELNKELEIQNVKINEEKSTVEVLIADITEKTKIADEQNAVAIKSKKELEVKTVQIDQEKAEADKMLEEAMPALIRAEQMLDKIDKSEIANIKKLVAPAEAIKFVCKLCYYLRPTEKEDDADEWADIQKKMLSDTDFLAKLKAFKGDKKDRIKKKDIQRCDKLINQMSAQVGGDIEAIEKKVKQSSESALMLFKWCLSIMQYYNTAKEVKPKKQKVQFLTQELIKLKADLEETEQNLAELSEKLSRLKDTRDRKENDLRILTDKSNQMQRRLNAAMRLITGLGSEQIRWANDQTILQESVEKLVGDCLLCASFLSYIGPFNQEFRQKMLYEDWYSDISTREIPVTAKFTIQSLLTNDVEISKWASEGLPQDELSIQNGILTTRASRFPLCIDPQLQAIAWIKVKEKRTDPFIVTFNSSDYMKKIQSALMFGKAVIFEGVDEIDPLIDPILDQQYVIHAGQKMIKLGDDLIDWDDNFKLYLASKIANPQYTPEIFGKAMIINYNVTMQGLREQLLNETVKNEKPALEKMRQQLVHEMSENRAKLKEQEDMLLSELSNTTGPLVDNEDLILTLEAAKEKANEISQALEEAKKTSENIDQQRAIYQPVAKLGAILFFAMFGLSAISEMYEYSLSSYLDVFKQALLKARPDNIPQNRIRYIKDTLNQQVYRYTCTGIFERHKLMFAFQMSTMIMDGDGELNRRELEFFLKGNTSLEQVKRKKPFHWISDMGWKDMQKLEEMPEPWASFADAVIGNETDWKEWYDLDNPEKSPLPNEYSEKLNRFQKLLVVRILRPDRVVNAIKQFIIEQNGPQYVTPPTLDYNNIFSQSTERSPIVFILSPGADPLGDVQDLAEKKGFGNKFKFLSLGQGMGAMAKNKLDSGVVKGHWVMLQNCHLLTSWLKELEAIIEEKILMKPHPDFRLWLSTSPTKLFPLGILQKSMKVVTEPPEGLKQNMKSTFSKINDDMLKECVHPCFKPLVFVLSFFHAVVQDRRKFGKIGWNVTYAFNESDFQISFRLLSMYLTKAYDNHEENLPWNSLRYLIGEAMYGGRVTDDFDRRVLMTYLNEYMGEFLFDINQPFYFSKAEYDYAVPKANNFEQYFKSIIEMPDISTPEVFGLHLNAEISYFTNYAKEIWANLLSMQTTQSQSESGENREEKLEQIADEILSKLPEEFNVREIKKNFKFGETNADIKATPTQIVLIQELERFNTLINKINFSLINLKRALTGEIGMSSDLDELAFALYNGFLPASWRRLAPQTEKNLSNWIQHFLKRNEQYKFWETKEEPIVMWLSGLHIPESYLTALVQMTCRAKDWPLDKSALYTVVTKHTKPQQITQRLPHGCYISGLFLEGAKWDIKRNCLGKQEPKELVTEMPITQIIPVELNKRKLRGTIDTPVYVTQSRKNAMGEGLVFEANLNTEEHVSHWILQGVCIVLNID